MTVSGRTCQSWSSSTPHTHVFNHGNLFTPCSRHVFNHGNLLTPCSLQLRQLVHSLQTTRLQPRQHVDTQQSSTTATCSHPADDTSSTRTICSPTAASRTPPTTAATRTDTAPAHPTALFSSLLFCFQPSSIHTMDALPPFILIDSSRESPVHVLMLSIQAVCGLPRLRAPGIVPCTVSFSGQRPCCFPLLARVRVRFS